MLCSLLSLGIPKALDIYGRMARQCQGAFPHERSFGDRLPPLIAGGGVRWGEECGRRHGAEPAGHGSAQLAAQVRRGRPQGQAQPHHRGPRPAPGRPPAAHVRGLSREGEAGRADQGEREISLQAAVRVGGLSSRVRATMRWYAAVQYLTQSSDTWRGCRWSRRESCLCARALTASVSFHAFMSRWKWVWGRRNVLLTCRAVVGFNYSLVCFTIPLSVLTLIQLRAVPILPPLAYDDGGPSRVVGPPLSATRFSAGRHYSNRSLGDDPVVRRLERIIKDLASSPAVHNSGVPLLTQAGITGQEAGSPTRSPKRSFEFGESMLDAPTGDLPRHRQASVRKVRHSSFLIHLVSLFSRRTDPSATPE